MYSVVIIEDEALIRKGLFYALDWAALNCIVVGEAENGEKGLKLIEEKRPDIVILDINMPILNGIDMMARIEKIDFQPIILSGYDEFEYAQKAIDFGVCAYLLKPVDHEELIKAIQKAIGKIADRTVTSKAASDLKNILEKLDLEDISAGENYSKATHMVIDYIKVHYSEKISVEDLVDHTFRSKTYLNSKFKQDTGQTINNYLNLYRIREAIRLIRDTDETIDYISEKVGFANYRYFITVFKKYVGQTPTEFSEKYFQK